MIKCANVTIACINLNFLRNNLQRRPVNFFHRIRELIYGNRRAKLPVDSTRAQRGVYGEDLAAAYCRRELGYRQIARNWRYRRDEIDLICRDGGVLVFIEVRLRSATALVSGFHSVDRKKKAILRRACGNYLRQLQNPPKHFRFDVIEVTLSKDGDGDVRHYANIELFSKYYSAGNR